MDTNLRPITFGDKVEEYDESSFQEFVELPISFKDLQAYQQYVLEESLSPNKLGLGLGINTEGRLILKISPNLNNLLTIDENGELIVTLPEGAGDHNHNGTYSGVKIKRW